MGNYEDEAANARQKLNEISPTMCMAKWLQVSLHLLAGGQSCTMASEFGRQVPFLDSCTL